MEFNERGNIKSSQEPLHQTQKVGSMGSEEYVPASSKDTTVDAGKTGDEESVVQPSNLPPMKSSETSTDSPTSMKSDETPTDPPASIKFDETSTDPPTSVKSGETSTDPPTSVKSGEMSTEPPTFVKSGETSTDPPMSVKSGETSTDPPASIKSGETSTDPPTSVKSGETSTDPPTDIKSGETSTDPPTSVKSGKMSTDPPTSVQSGETSVDPPASVTSGETSTDPPTSVKSSEMSTDPPTSVKSGETSTDPPASVTSGEMPTDPPTSVKSGEMSTDPPTYVKSGETSTDPPASIKSGETSTDPPTSMKSDEMPTDAPTSVKSGEASTDPPTSVKSGETSTEPPTFVKSDETSTDPPMSVKSGKTSTDPPASIKSGETSTDPPTSVKSGETSTDPPTSVTSGETSTDSPTSIKSGETSTDPPTDIKSGETSTDPPTSVKSGKMSTDPPTSVQSGETSVDPPASVASGETPTDPPTSVKSGEMSTDPPTSVKSGETSTDPPASIKSGETSVDPPASIKSGKTSTDPPTSMKSDKMPTDAPTSVKSGETSVDPPASIKSGETSTDLPTSVKSGKMSTDPPTSVQSGETSVDPPASVTSGETSTDPPTSVKSGEMFTDPPTSVKSGKTSTDPPTSMKSDETPTDAPTSVKSGETSTDPPASVKCDETSVDPPASIKSGETSTDPATSVKSAERSTDPTFVKRDKTSVDPTTYVKYDKTSDESHSADEVYFQSTLEGPVKPEGNMHGHHKALDADHKKSTTLNVIQSPDAMASLKGSEVLQQEATQHSKGKGKQRTQEKRLAAQYHPTHIDKGKKIEEIHAFSRKEVEKKKEGEKRREDDGGDDHAADDHRPPVVSTAGYSILWWALLALLLAILVGGGFQLLKISPKGINCGPLDEPKNGFVLLSGTAEGATATYSCRPGFVLEPEEENLRVCNHSGNWTGSVSKCRRVDCSTPKQLRDGTVSYDGTGYNMVVVYKCDEGYSLIGPSKRVCQSNGKWSGEEPLCEPVRCSELEHPINGKVVCEIKERTFRSKAHYTCNDGFDLRGDEYRTCQASRSWSGNAPFCEFTQERRADETAFSIYQKINRIQNIASQLENQAFIAHALEMISVNVADGRLQAGIVGLIKSGKSTTLNALMKTRILPEAVQPETAAVVHIIHSTKEQHKNGLLLGEQGGQNIEIASGSDAIYKKLRQYNEMARKGKRLPHDSLTLRIPLPFLRESELNFSLEISDTAGPDEAGATDATLRSLSTMERLSVFIIVLNYRRMKSQPEVDLLTHLRDHHPQLLETHDRFLFIVNAIDAYYEDGNKYSIQPKDVREYVQTYLQDTLHVSIPTERIVPFSAKWALQSHLWHEDPKNISNADYMSAVGLSSKIQNEEPSKNMRIPSLENKKVVASHLKDFSGIRELEPKLYRMLGINGPVILYKGAIDDTVAHISTLKKHIEKERVKYDITSTTAPLHLHEQLSEALNQAITTNHQRMHELAKNLDDNSGRSIHRWSFTIQEELSEKLSSLSNSGTVDSPLTNPEEQVVKLANEILGKAWSKIMSNVTGELRESVETLFSELKNDIERINKTYKTKLVLHELNYDKLPKPPSFNFHLSIPSDVEPITVSALQKRDIATEWAVHIRKTTEAEANKLSMQSFKKAEKGCRTRVEKLQNEVVEKIKHLRQELEAKQKEMERLNQMEYQLETVRRQLLAVREEFQFADEEEEKVVEVKKVKVKSGASSQPHYCPSVITLLLNTMMSAAVYFRFY